MEAASSEAIRFFCSVIKIIVYKNIGHCNSICYAKGLLQREGFVWQRDIGSSSEKSSYNRTCTIKTRISCDIR